LDFLPLCFQKTKVMLLEMPRTLRPRWDTNVIYQLTLGGVIPLIAHIERYPYVQKNPNIALDWIEAGEVQMMGPADLMRETRLFLEHIDSEGSVFRSNHASNYLPLGGTLNRDREALIQTIDAALDGKVRLRRAVELGL